jgi:hypothetical protein
MVEPTLAVENPDDVRGPQPLDIHLGRRDAALDVDPEPLNQCLVRGVAGPVRGERAVRRDRAPGMEMAVATRLGLAIASRSRSGSAVGLAMGGGGYCQQQANETTEDKLARRVHGKLLCTGR